MSLEEILTQLAVKMTGATPTERSIEGILKFIVDNYKAAGAPTLNVRVGTVTTGNPGSQAAVTNSGSGNNVVLDFTIPRGDKGNPGDAGQGVPTGGTTGQVLAKKSNNNYDTQWVNDKTAAGG